MCFCAAGGGGAGGGHMFSRRERGARTAFASVESENQIGAEMGEVSKWKKVFYTLFISH